MKHLYISLLIISACSNHNESTSPLVGTWKVQSQNKVCTNSANNFSDKPCLSSCASITFTSNTYTYKDGSGAVLSTGTYTQTGVVITTTPAYIVADNAGLTFSNNRLQGYVSTLSDGCVLFSNYSKM